MKRVISIILGGGRGTRLFPLTRLRSKPAVPFGGKYRLVDIPISNCLHAGIDRIYVLTQFNSASLNRHVTRTYRFGAFTDGFVEILAAEQTLDNTSWYQGTADAVRHHLRRITAHPVDQCLILSGDHVYEMDYRDFIHHHRASGADLTIAVKPVTRENAPNFGILKLGEAGRIVDFVEKPQSAAELDYLCCDHPTWEDRSKPYLASMGIYVFELDVLEKLLAGEPKTDFGRHIIPTALKDHHVQSFFFHGYWEDIGTIRAFYEANLALTDPEPQFNLYRTDAPLYTRSRHLPGTRLDGCSVQQAIICEGAKVLQSRIVRSIIGIRGIVGNGSSVKDTIMMGSDYYESPEELAENRSNHIPDLGIGDHCQIAGAIIDKNTRIGHGVVIREQQRPKELDGDNFFIRDGVVVIPKNAIIPAGTII
ncbi:MAG: glucose-1-phosphate adenylyltransferase [Bradymonadales bacterium]|nr:glucose-1-phosphate adenylyltransferase [Bradymonadales bacterium]